MVHPFEMGTVSGKALGWSVSVTEWRLNYVPLMEIHGNATIVPGDVNYVGFDLDLPELAPQDDHEAVWHKAREQGLGHLPAE